MAISKIILNGVTQMDVTGVTATASQVQSGYTGIGADGVGYTGSYSDQSIVFTITTNETTGEDEVTCNKTYSEVYDAVFDYTHSNYAAEVVAENVTFGAVYSKLISVYGQPDAIVFTGFEVPWSPIGEIRYYEDGSIEANNTSFVTSLYVTQNGTYIPTQQLYNEVEVALPVGDVTSPSTISSTGATVSTGTNTLTFSKTVSVTPNVTTPGVIYAGTPGNSNVSLTANVTTKAAATITPGTSNQTIASGTYLTGTQTIVGDSDLVGSNIISTANIFNVQGTVVIQKYYTGSSTPSSSLGNNGDIYLQT